MLCILRSMKDNLEPQVQRDVLPIQPFLRTAMILGQHDMQPELHEKLMTHKSRNRAGGGTIPVSEKSFSITIYPTQR